MMDGENGLHRVDAVDVAQPHQAQRGDHQDADPRAEIAAVDRHQELEDSHARCSRAATAAARRRAAETAGLEWAGPGTAARPSAAATGPATSKYAGGKRVTSNEPTTPPTRLGPTSSASQGPASPSSRRKPHAPAREPGTSATVLVPLASTSSETAEANQRRKGEQRAAAGDGVDQAGREGRRRPEARLQ